MAIKIGNLNFKNPETNHIFTDFSYNLFPIPNNSVGGLNVRNDLNASYDLQAIKNEISNLLNTPKYSRILNPDFGFDFNGWIGKAVTQGFAEMQRMNIVNLMKSGSRRFSLDDLQIIAVPDQLLYYVEMKISSPYFTIFQNLQGTVNQGGKFSFI
jgi:phage baseplate assembly protein W